MVVKDIKTLEGLIEELKTLGYHKYQIKEIVAEAVNKRDVMNLTEGEVEKVKQALANYIQFARKCLDKSDK